jgi:hypothetical protein
MHSIHSILVVTLCMLLILYVLIGFHVFVVVGNRVCVHSNVLKNATVFSGATAYYFWLLVSR